MLQSADFTALHFPADFSDRISRSRRVGYESGEFEIVSSSCPGVPPLTFEENITPLQLANSRGFQGLE